MYHLFWQLVTAFYPQSDLCILYDSQIKQWSISSNSIYQFIYLMDKCCAFWVRGWIFKYHLGEFWLQRVNCVIVSSDLQIVWVDSQASLYVHVLHPGNELLFSCIHYKAHLFTCLHYVISDDILIPVSYPYRVFTNKQAVYFIRKIFVVCYWEILWLTIWVIMV